MFHQYFLAILSVLLYIHGFFPIPPPRKQHVDLPKRFEYKPTLKYEKAVLVVIDALRLDFVPSENMEWLTKMYQEKGCYSQLKVETPTVTLPRVKALTMGTIPQFIDIIMNLASPTIVEDSLIHRAKEASKRIVFYGDDTWLKLFPNHFVRSEGTTSFFVNDFWEVDNNVTRNVREELKRSDWDLMILHYLGLDHIGHVYGPKSSLIPTKLQEMDAIIKDIYENLQKSQESFLIVVTGDHGMRDSGGHGGSTFSETNIPFIVLGMPCKNSSFLQIDVATNLAVLFGFEPPSTNMGTLQYSLLSNMTLDAFLTALSYNTFLLKSKLDVCDNLDTAVYFHDLFLLEKNVEIGLKAVKYYQECSIEISNKLIKSSVSQNVASLLIATITSLSVLVKLVQNSLGIGQKSNLFEFTIQVLLVVLQFFNGNDLIACILVLIASIFLLKDLYGFINPPWKFIKDHISLVLFLLILHPLSFLSSSFVEEEHQFWYFLFSTIIFLQLINYKQYYLLPILIGVRVLRTINQVGDKWSSHPDLADWLNQKENSIYLILLFIMSLVLISYCLVLNDKRSQLVMDGSILSLICIYRLIGENVTVARITWMLLIGKFLYFVYSKSNFVSVWMLIVSLLMKPHNHILIPFCVFTSVILGKSIRNQTVLAMIHWWLGNMMYFLQGHDNSFASVDIAVGYVGLTTYQPLFVFPQVLCHTYAFPVLSHLLVFQNRTEWREYLRVFFTFRLYTVIIVFIVMFIQRHHLFVWSVFAPKMFVEASHTAFLFIEMCIFYVCKN